MGNVVKLPGSISDLNGSTTVVKVIKARNYTFLIKTDGCLYYEEINKNSCNHIFISKPAIKIEASVCNNESQDWGRIISWEDQAGKHHRRILPLISDDGTNVRKIISDGGVVIPPESLPRKMLNCYLQYAEPESEEVAELVYQVGWHDEAYVTPNEIIGEEHLNPHRIIVFKNEGFQNVFEQKGTLQEWKENISIMCLGNPRLMFAISASLASVILTKLEIEGGGFHFFGSSSSGKSTALNVAASVMSNRKFKKSWRSTNNGLESIAALHNDNILILDEFKECDEKNITKIIYMLGNGQGKLRATQNAEAIPIKEWKLLFLSSGETRLREIALANQSKLYQGEEVRLADIDANSYSNMGIFDDIHNFANPSDFAEYLNTQTNLYYGTAGHEFLVKLTQDLQESTKFLINVKKQFMKDPIIDKEDGPTKRVITRFATVAAAGELATKFGITGWKEGDAINAVNICLASWLENYKGKYHKQHELLSYLTEYIETNSNKFQTISSSNTYESINDFAGYREEENDRYIYYFVNSVFKGIASQANLIPNEAAQILKELGILIPDTNNKLQTSKTHKKHTIRSYAIDSKKLTELSKED